jgi:hypothetical protein
MKSLPKILSLLTISTMMVSCNEKISPELQSGGSTTLPGGGPSTSSNSNYVFKLEQTSGSMLRYKMHKTGEGNNNVECKIDEETFSTTLFQGDPGTYDITCFLEAEEQSLYYSGVDLKLTASPNLCENVVYAPFNFFQYQPGSSSRSVNLYRCAAELNGSMSGTYKGANPSSTYSNASCDKAVDLSVGITAAGRSVETDQDLCDFDYTEAEGPNCDSGIISVNEITIGIAPAYCTNSSYDNEEDCTTNGSSWNTTHLQASPAVNRLHKCSGKLANCRAGAGISGTESTFKGIIADINQSTADTPFEKEVTLSSPSSLGHFTNMSIANFVRQCSGSIDNSDPLFFATAPYSSFGKTERKKFDPNVIDRYSVGINYWDNSNTTEDYFSAKLAYPTYHSPRSSAANSVVTTPGPGWKVTYHAADSFMTTLSAINHAGSISKAAANPFYAFYCLNNALDIKARIRLVVRDWDQFPDYENHDFELLSDIFEQQSTYQNGRMDTIGQELSEDNNPFNDFNDVQDWDDFFRDQSLDIPAGPIRPFDKSCSGPGGSETWYSPNLFPGSGL